jgi:hypothetical protein
MSFLPKLHVVSSNAPCRFFQRSIVLRCTPIRTQAVAISGQSCSVRCQSALIRCCTTIFHGNPDVEFTRIIPGPQTQRQLQLTSCLPCNIRGVRSRQQEAAAAILEPSFPLPHHPKILPYNCCALLRLTARRVLYLERSTEIQKKQIATNAIFSRIGRPHSPTPLNHFSTTPPYPRKPPRPFVAPYQL